MRTASFASAADGRAIQREASREEYALSFADGITRENVNALLPTATSQFIETARLYNERGGLGGVRPGPDFPQTPSQYQARGRWDAHQYVGGMLREHYNGRNRYHRLAMEEVRGQAPKEPSVRARKERGLRGFATEVRAHTGEFQRGGSVAALGRHYPMDDIVSAIETRVYNPGLRSAANRALTTRLIRYARQRLARTARFTGTQYQQQRQLNLGSLERAETVVRGMTE